MRLLIVSNRLPVTLEREDDALTIKESVGGLVSGLSAYLDSMKGSEFVKSEHVWIGWPGATIDPEDGQEAVTRAREFDGHPVFLSEEAMDKFYHGFCNKTIWPLFHYFSSYVVYEQEYWDEYKRVNQRFCDAIAEICQPGDIVWIHDYHLMLVPGMLRARTPDIPIGFFLHIPFPFYEIFRLLPDEWGKELLQGMLGADLIGFHTHDYAEYFLRCVLRILGYEHKLGQMIVDGRVKKVEAFPMGIDFERYHNAARRPEIRKTKNALEKAFAETKIILSIDRLDYTKGVINRLLAYESFLEKNPAWLEKVMFSMVIVPSRMGVDQYQETKRQIDELVGKINGRFGTMSWTPILYQYKYLPADQLIGLYASSDVALITPLRDGMNLVAKEYIAARTDQTGVLILSEMAGASKELGEAIIVNPNDIEDIARALQQALEMPRDEQIRRNRIMQTRLKRYDVVRWADDFLHTLLAVNQEQEKIGAKYLTLQSRERLADDFIQARRRIVLLDYDGTLTPLIDNPSLAKPSKQVLGILARLAEIVGNELVIISGRDRGTLEEWFGALPVHLVAEHGGWIKDKNGTWQMLKPLTKDWKPQLLPILELYCDRVPGSFVEEKEFSIVWHFRKADPELGAARAKELEDDLLQFTANIPIQVLQGSKVIEVRNAGVDKGAGSQHWLNQANFDFVLAAGDDVTDEELFKVLPPTAFSIKIGMAPTSARYNLRSPSELIELLSKIADLALVPGDYRVAA
jgi:trehalose 6-phosphate synthase/phosphatase